MENNKSRSLFNRHKIISLILFIVTASFANTAALAENINRLRGHENQMNSIISPLNLFGYLPASISSLLFYGSLMYLIFSLIKFRQIKIHFYAPKLKFFYNFFKFIGRFFVILLMWVSALSMGIVFDHLEPNRVALNIFFMQTVLFALYLTCLLARRVLIAKNRNLKSS